MIVLILLLLYVVATLELYNCGQQFDTKRSIHVPSCTSGVARRYLYVRTEIGVPRGTQSIVTPAESYNSATFIYLAIPGADVQ